VLHFYLLFIFYLLSNLPKKDHEKNYKNPIIPIPHHFNQSIRNIPHPTSSRLVQFVLTLSTPKMIKKQKKPKCIAFSTLLSLPLNLKNYPINTYLIAAAQLREERSKKIKIKQEQKTLTFLPFFIFFEIS
jgi:hypothetical protein